jgi:tetratricopeptide (TPR) repeat protein
LRFPADFATALRWAFLPHPLSLREDLAGEGFGLCWWAGAILICAVVAAVLFFWNRNRIAAGIILAFCATISPSLLGLQYASSFDPRYLYVPGAFLAIGAGIGFVRLSPLLRYTLIPLLASLLLLSLIRIHAWSDNFAFWKLEYERQPDHALSVYNFGAANEEKKDFPAAIALYAEAARLAEQQKDRIYTSYANYRIGYLLNTLFQNKTEALHYYEKAVRADPTSRIWISIGNIHAADSNFEKALAAYQKAEVLDTHSYVVHVSLANALTGLKRFDEAMARMERARRMLSPDDERMKAFERRRQMIIDYRHRVEGTDKP